MADTLHSVQGVLGTSAGDIVDAVPSSTTETVIGILVSNVSSSSADVTIDLSVTKSGGTLRHVLNNVSLPFGTTIEITTKIDLYQVFIKITYQVNPSQQQDIVEIGANLATGGLAPAY